MPEAGEVIGGRYRLEDKLGDGAMGSVWRATHATLGSEMAIKIIKRHAARNARSVARFEREAVLAAKINSAHVVRVTDHGNHQGLPFIVMEHLVGEDLRARIRDRGRLSLQDTALVVKHVCRALAAAHAIGLVHRDVKPENIFISPGEDEGEERAVVLDFGVAKSSDTFVAIAPTQTGAVIGTPYYLSPEQAQGLKTVGPPADLWAVAVVAFECLTGARPFDAPSIGPLIAEITHGPIPVPSEVWPGLPPSIDAWFAHALSRDPEARFASPQELTRTFDEAIAGASSEAVVQLARDSAANTVVLPETLGVTTTLGGSNMTLDQTIALPDAEASDDGKTVPMPPEMTFDFKPPPQPAHHGSDWPEARARKPTHIGLLVAGVALVGAATAAATYFLLSSTDPDPAPAEVVDAPSTQTAPSVTPPTPSVSASASGEAPSARPSAAPAPQRRRRNTHRRKL